MEIKKKVNNNKKTGVMNVKIDWDEPISEARFFDIALEGINEVTREKLIRFYNYLPKSYREGLLDNHNFVFQGSYTKDKVMVIKRGKKSNKAYVLYDFHTRPINFKKKDIKVETYE